MNGELAQANREIRAASQAIGQLNEGLFLTLAKILDARDPYVGGHASQVAGYAAAWVGHFFFEKNRPATFTYPLYSFLGDWVMLRDMLTGRIKF